MNVNRAVFGRTFAAVCVGLFAGCGGGGYGGGEGEPAATQNISVEPATITLGQSATLTWSSNPGTTCRASGAWSGTKAASGSETVTPTAAGSFMYSILCSGGGYSEGTAGSTTLTVNPTVGFTQTILVSKLAGTAALTTDAKLVDPKGIALERDTAAWVASDGAVTAYDGNGRGRGAASAAARDFEATGIVIDTTTHFVVTAGRGGMIGVSSASGSAATPAIVYTDTDGAVYTGLALARAGTGNFIYAADFVHNKIDVFDENFAKQTASPASFAFSDPTLPAGYAPFGIQAIESGPDRKVQIFVSYARALQPDARDHATGAGLGMVNVFDTHGRLLRRLVSAGGALNAPWGMALAPADFGALGNAFLIGNTGDGKINAYDPASGKLIGTVTDADGRAIVTQGLWGIAFGNGAGNQPRNALFFAASTAGVEGVYGRIDPGVAALTLD